VSNATDSCPAGALGAQDAPGTQYSPLSPIRARLFAKYLALLVGMVSVPLLLSGAFEIWSTYRDHRTSLMRLQREQAEAAAVRIGSFVKEIEGQIELASLLAGAAGTLEQRRFAIRLLLRQVPAITELVAADADGREQLRISRLDMDVIGSNADLSGETKFAAAMVQKVFYGPVYFRSESEPYMTVAIAGARREAGVVIAEVNLKLIWDVVSQIKVGDRGSAYVVDAEGRLIAHPDIGLVLRNTDLSQLVQVEAAVRGATDAAPDQGQVAADPQGRQVLSAHANIVPPGWLMFVELPLEEALAPVYASLLAAALVLLAGLLLAVISSFALARRMVTPIRALQAGAARIGAGALDHRIAIATGDELETLGAQFNSMASQLQQSYATLEHKVDERTLQLHEANLAKSRFLAAASHDLRQPLHALGLFVAQLRGNAARQQNGAIIARIEASIAAMNELFGALLDISKLDAEVLKPSLAAFPVQTLFHRLETTFGEAAREKALRLRVVPSDACVRSDAILLERIMLNLVANAVRYTQTGGVVLGARRRGAMLRLELWDSGPGVPEDQLRNIFAEFYQVTGAQRNDGGGLGLGLAIVERLCGLLDHRIEVRSRVGRGSCFSILVPLVEARPQFVQPVAAVQLIDDPCKGKLVVVLDDDPMVLEGMRGLLVSWGCRAVTADSDGDALTALARHAEMPDLIISDYRLAAGKTGFDAVARLRGVLGTDIPAFLISGDTAPERLREASASGFRLLHKPVPPHALRAILSQLLRKAAAVPGVDMDAPAEAVIRAPAGPSPASRP
jgi:signal transduction histidine kinase/CheY-like chemotaxis protein